MKALGLMLAAVFALLQGIEIRILERTEPVYPPLARAAGVQGAVRLSVKVRPDGSVEGATAVDGHPLLRDAAEQAARQWKFTPTPSGGEADVSIGFTLPGMGSITGKVVNTEGRPMAGLRVGARTMVYRAGRPSWNERGAVGVTDDQGIYRLSVPYGTYYVAVSYTGPHGIAPGPSDNYAPQTYYPGTPDGAAAVPIRVAQGPDAIADIRIPFMDTVRISGRVAVPSIDRSAGGLLRLRLLWIDPRFAPESVSEQDIPVEGRPDVPFELRGVRPGIHEIEARVLTGPPPTWLYSSRLRVDSTNGDLNDVVIVPRAHPELSGRLVSQDSSSRLQKASITLRSREYSGGDILNIAADGTFRATTLPEDRYDLELRGLPDSTYISDLRLGSLSIYADGVIPVEDPSRGDLQIVLSSNGGSILGTVRTLQREGVEAHVFLVPDVSRRRNPLLYRNVKSDASGAFQLEAIPPGDYKLFAFEEAPPPGAMQSGEFIARYEQHGLPMLVRAGTVQPGVELAVIPKS